MPVLKEREVISKIAVPVVSEPVPAVVGIAIRGNKVLVMGSPLPTGALMKSIKSASLYTENLEGRRFVACANNRWNSYKLAAFAVSMTLPPPTLDIVISE